MRVRSGWWTQRFARVSRAVPTSPTLEAPEWRELGTAPTERAERADLDGPTVNHTPADGVPAPRGAPPGLRVARSSTPPLRRVEQFVLLELIGAGGMGVVYAASTRARAQGRAQAARGRDARRRRARPRSGWCARRRRWRSCRIPTSSPCYDVGTLPDGRRVHRDGARRGRDAAGWLRARAAHAGARSSTCSSRPAAGSPPRTPPASCTATSSPTTCSSATTAASRVTDFGLARSARRADGADARRRAERAAGSTPRRAARR